MLKVLDQLIQILQGQRSARRMRRNRFPSSCVIQLRSRCFCVQYNARVRAIGTPSHQH